VGFFIPLSLPYPRLGELLFYVGRSYLNSFIPGCPLSLRLELFFSALLLRVCPRQNDNLPDLPPAPGVPFPVPKAPVYAQPSLFDFPHVVSAPFPIFFFFVFSMLTTLRPTQAFLPYDEVLPPSPRPLPFRRQLLLNVHNPLVLAFGYRYDLSSTSFIGEKSSSLLTIDYMKKRGRYSFMRNPLVWKKCPLSDPHAAGPTDFSLPLFPLRKCCGHMLANPSYLPRSEACRPRQWHYKLPNDKGDRELPSPRSSPTPLGFRLEFFREEFPNRDLAGK